MSEGPDFAAAPGFLESRVRTEFPGLVLAWTAVSVRRGPSPRWVMQRLGRLSDRVHGATVVAMRTKPIPHAYRSFFRQIGLDPDVTRIPSEEAAVARLLQGGFRSTDPLADALLISVVETGVPVWALRGDLVEASGLGIRTTVAGEAFGQAGPGLAAGRLAVSDERRLHALLFGPLVPGHAADARTPRVVLFAVGAPGVPAIHVEEALWTSSEVLTV